MGGQKKELQRIPRPEKSQQVIPPTPTSNPSQKHPQGRRAQIRAPSNAHGGELDGLYPNIPKKAEKRNQQAHIPLRVIPKLRPDHKVTLEALSTSLESSKKTYNQ